LPFNHSCLFFANGIDGFYILLLLLLLLAACRTPYAQHWGYEAIGGRGARLACSLACRRFIRALMLY
jgi:hypothetical protein